MKFIHLSDLHLGKRINEFSMLEEQGAILSQIIDIIDAEAPNGVLIAGDIYDKTVPSAEAVALFDDFLAQLAKRSLEVFVISGNHDSPERIAFGSRIMDGRGIHMSPVYSGEICPFELEDEFGKVRVYMLPFIKPGHIRRFFEDRDIVSYTDAVRVAVEEMNVDMSLRNILVTHQFVTGSEPGGSEELTVGGTDNVDASVLECFDYVALGHIHGAQNCGSGKIRYCGTPLKYSFSEEGHKKTVTVVELGEKNEGAKIREIPLTPIHDMSTLRGSFEELTDPVFYSSYPAVNDYMRIILTDEDDLPDAYARLRIIYKNLMVLRYDNKRTRENSRVTSDAAAETKTAYQLFAEFFEMQNNSPMSEEQSNYIKELIEKIEDELA